VAKQFGTMPFNLRSMEDEKKARMGVVECVTHKLIEPFQVLYEKEGKRHFLFRLSFLIDREKRKIWQHLMSFIFGKKIVEEKF
jgi:hypothetical protein